VFAFGPTPVPFKINQEEIMADIREFQINIPQPELFVGELRDCFRLMR
jgi:hypothetical protein